MLDIGYKLFNFDGEVIDCVLCFKFIRGNFMVYFDEMDSLAEVISKQNNKKINSSILI